MSAKETKEEANYRKGRPDYKCSLCTMFRDPHGCTTVKGIIDRRAVCDYFEPK